MLQFGSSKASGRSGCLIRYAGAGYGLEYRTSIWLFCLVESRLGDPFWCYSLVRVGLKVVVGV